ncbi:MAG: hypothetical protein ACLRQF_02850 [Thomasclavelia ramosa]
MGALEQDEKYLGSLSAGPTIILLFVVRIRCVVRIKEELGALIKDWQVVKLELDNRGYIS